MIFNEIPLLFQNADFVAVDKPAGISVHNAEDPQNLLDVLEKQLGQKVFPVHRLDKETSGIQILALNEASARKLSLEFEKREVRKMYTGLLRGKLKDDTGVWKHPLTDKAEGRKNPAGQPRERVPCETGFKVLHRSDYFTLCAFDLKTGRQHQIRKHAAIANHALVGDPRYGDSKYNLKMAGIYKTSRLFLHCTEMEIGGEKIIGPVPESFKL
jgi:RluA family pseudouridine synthase